MTRNHGFTLIETVVALALFATGGTYIYSTFAAVTASSSTATV
ncbi:MAG: PulJ/GspJ family protein, partial [Planctomycetaceae bacterium]